MINVPDIVLPNGNVIPQVGLGLWKVKDQTKFNTAFEAAIADGYRHFDSAQAYENEQFLGAAWRASGLPREELFVTTKIAVTNFGHQKVLSSFDSSISKLQTNYVDLLLLHFPVTILRKKAWQALEEIQASGRAKSIGVSN